MSFREQFDAAKQEAIAREVERIEKLIIDEIKSNPNRAAVSVTENKIPQDAYENLMRTTWEGRVYHVELFHGSAVLRLTPRGQ